MLIEFEDCDVSETDGKYGVVKDARTYGIVGVGEDDAIYIVVDKNPDVAEDDWTYGIIDLRDDDVIYVIVNKNPGVAEDDGIYGVVGIGDEAGTWDVLELVKQSMTINPLTHVQVSGAMHFLLVSHGELQIAVLRGINMIHDQMTCAPYVLSSHCLTNH